MNKQIRVGVLLCVLALTACGGGGSSSSDNSCLGTRSLNTVAYRDGIFIGGGQDECQSPLMEASTDGITWKVRDTGDVNADPDFGNNFQQVAAGAPGFVAVDSVGSVFFSPEGGNWTDISASFASAAPTIIDSVAWDGSQFILIASDTFVSKDGVHWTDLGPNNADTAATVFLKVGGTWFGLVSSADLNFNYVYVTSTDLMNWTGQSPVGIPHDNFADMIFVGGKYYGVGALVAYSSDGLNWTRASLPAGVKGTLLAVAWNGKVFVAVGQSAAVIYSHDGINWSQADVSALLSKTEAAPDLSAIAVQPDGRFVAVSPTGGQPLEITSTDGVHWVLGHP